jgi:hypothetical protein
MVTSRISDFELEYPSIRWRFREGEGLLFDESYRIAHLPLIAPQSSEAICVGPGDYRMGRYRAARHSLVLPIGAEALSKSESFAWLETRDSSFVEKIDWSLLPRRAAKLHVTLCTGLEAGDLHAIIGTAQQFLPHTRAIAAQVGGPLVGNKNTGRIISLSIRNSASISS